MNRILWSVPMVLCGLLLTTANAQLIKPPDHKAEAPSPSIAYVPQQGQFADVNGEVIEDLLYAAYGHGVKLYVRENCMFSYVGTQHVPDSIGPDTTLRLDVQLVGELVNYDPQVAHDEETEWYHNYYLAHCTQGITGVHGYKVVALYDVYPGINMYLYSNKWGYKIYLEVQPGADPTNIALKFEGQDDLQIDYLGALEAVFGNKELKIPQAIAYQLIGGTTVPVPGWPEYDVNNNTGIVNFNFEPYDTDYPLILDISESLGAAGGGGGGGEVPEWGSYFAGGESEWVNDVTATSDNGMVACGASYSPAFPVFAGIDLSLDGPTDAFIARFNDQYSRTYCTFYGGYDDEEAFGVDERQGELYLVARTHSDPADIDWVQPGGAYVDDQRVAGGWTVFLVHFDAAGTQVIWNTLYGIDCCMVPADIVVDNDGQIVVAGTVEWTWPDPFSGPYYDLPVVTSCLPGNNEFNVCGGGYSQAYMPYTYYQPLDQFWYDGWIAVFKDTHELSWSTLFGGSAYLDKLTDVDVDRNTQDIYVSGFSLSPLGTNSPGTPPAPLAAGFPWLEDPGGYYQAQAPPGVHYHGNEVAFVAAFDGQTHDLMWCTPFGPSGNEITNAHAIDVDEQGGSVTIVGQTTADQYSTSCTTPSIDGIPQCNQDYTFTQSAGALAGASGFTARFREGLHDLRWCSYITGGIPWDVSSEQGYVVLTGDRGNGFLHQQNPDVYFNDQPLATGAPGFAIGVKPAALEFATAWGGNEYDWMYDVDVTVDGERIYIGNTAYSQLGMPYNCPPTLLPWCVDLPASSVDLFFGQIIRDLVHIDVPDAAPRQSGLLVYPNPVSDELFIHWNAPSSVQLVVYDQLGRLVMQHAAHPPQGNVSISTAYLASGCYNVVLLGEQGRRVATARFVRQP